MNKKEKDEIKELIKQFCEYKETIHGPSPKTKDLIRYLQVNVWLMANSHKEKEYLAETTRRLLMCDKLREGIKKLHYLEE